MRIVASALVAIFVSVVPAWSASDFPLASCKGWNGTVTERDGIDMARVAMRGVVTKADLQEYCERDPGGETKQHGGKLTKAQCVDGYLRTEMKAVLSVEANCRAGTVSYRVGRGQPMQARFPLGADADSSCASGIPPLAEQFKMLCPTALRAKAIYMVPLPSCPRRGTKGLTM